MRLIFRDMDSVNAALVLFQVTELQAELDSRLRESRVIQDKKDVVEQKVFPPFVSNLWNN